MSSERQHLKRCTVTHRCKPTQAILHSRNGLLSFCWPSKPPHPRTPAPHAVRRIANEPAFSTNDPNLTSFLRFPAEIRMQIYRLLLLYHDLRSIEYHICLITRRLVLPRRMRKPYYPWMRHGIFPAILECCRTIEQEASEVLYGENRFSLGCSAMDGSSHWEAVHSWPLGSNCFRHITQLQAEDQWLKDPPRVEHLALFPQLKSLVISECMSGKQWKELLLRYEDVLQRIPRIEFRITVAHIQVQDILSRSRGVLQDGLWVFPGAELECKNAYLLSLDNHKELVNERIAQWEFRNHNDDYGILWEIIILLS